MIRNFETELNDACHYIEMMDAYEADKVKVRVLEQRVAKAIDLLDTRINGISMDWNYRGEDLTEEALCGFLNRLQRATAELEQLVRQAANVA